MSIGFEAVPAAGQMRVEGAGDRPVDPSRSASAPRLLKLPTPDFLSGGPSPVPGPEGETLDQLIEGACRKFASRDAVLTADGTAVTYADLDGRANRLSRHLIEAGVRPGDRVGVLLDRSDNTYVTLLAVMKAKAGYVPLDVSFPVERLRFIVGDAGLRTIVSTSRFQEKLDQVQAQAVLIDVAAREIAVRSPHPISVEEAAPSSDKLCYIIYTSGTTGTPKGVMIEHPSICNFVRVAAHLYGFRPGDRVYQGMTVAFDFSVEEIWVPLLAGATLVPAPPETTLVGEELGDFLRERNVTGMCCCPTLLASIESDVPSLRVLLVGGEACPQKLVARWYRPGRTILNSYGPTEATVTASIVELKPDEPVTIGRPLPTYSLVILDPAQARTVPPGELGEIGIAGIGLAVGYVNREDLTGQKFVPDFLEMPHNPSERIYRTGDLGRITEAGEVEYCGRIDTQVKIRGYRIELSEIEAVLLDQPAIAQAAVIAHEMEPGTPELVAYYALKQDMAAPSRAELLRALRRRLPAYMVPHYLEELPVIPMTLSNKADHKKLPKPTGGRLGSGQAVVAARTKTEEVLARGLAEVLRLEEVSVQSHFFDDLGANSLDMARFCARLRKQPGFGGVAMRDIYMHPTIGQLAEHVRHAVAEEEEVLSAAPETLRVPSDLSYWTCGALQLLFYAAYGLAALWAFQLSYEWIQAGLGDPLGVYLRAVAVAVASFVVATAIPIASKWLLIGRWKPETFPIWSLRYFRFWMVQTLTRTAPVVLFPGSPMFSLYLRLLGAKIGHNTSVETRLVPVCTDLLSIGSNTVIRKETVVLGYRARGNMIETGRVTVGAGAFVGEASVLDIDTAIGDEGQLGHGSSLHSGQRIPAGKRYHGSPAVETTANYCPVDNNGASGLRRAAFDLVQIFGLCAVAVPLPFLGFIYGEQAVAGSTGGMGSVAMLLLGSLAGLLGAFAATLAAALTIPRLLRPLLQPDRTYPLYGLRHWCQNMVDQASNWRALNLLFGDSTAIVHYMRALGWNLNKVEQTGSNFGTNQRHENPLLCEIGSGTMVSDGLSMINMHKSASSFRLSRTRIGDNNYLGNNIHYPPDGRTGANVLLGTKVMIPIDGPVRENVGLLGSPSFEIPRMVDRDRALCTALPEAERLERLSQKNRHNLATAIMFLAAQWMLLLGTIAIWRVALMSYEETGFATFFVASVASSAVAIALACLIERASLGFRPLQPRMTTIYEPHFWSHERHWKLADSPVLRLFPGTPFKNMISRIVGFEVGRKVYDGGCIVTERTLTKVGDYSNLNEGSVLQAHSLEEGVFKSDYIRLAEGVTVGPNAFVHYGVQMERCSTLDADSFLMKGETVEAGTTWRGNPARPRSRPSAEVLETDGSTAGAKLFTVAAE